MASIINATTSTGLVSSADNSGSLQLATNNGTTAVTIDTSQNVGIGTSSPAGKLNTDSAVAGDNTSSSATRTLILAQTSGSISTAAKLTVQGIIHPSVYRTILDSSTGSGASAPLAFQIAGTEAMRIDSSGRVCIGVTSAAYSTSCAMNVNVDAVSASGGAWVSKAASTSTAFHMNFQNGNGGVGGISTSGSATQYVTSSDYRLKNSITPMTGALTKVAQLKPVTYKWNSDNSDGEGFIAHELQAVVPNAVVGEKDAVDENGKLVYQGVDTSFLVATLTAAIQELNTDLANTKLLLTEVSNKVEAQAVRIAELEGAK